ncbi:MAG: restriction endonuclease, partial [Actinobacteria bacterium]
MTFLQDQRLQLHRGLIENRTLSLNSAGIASMADKNSPSSVKIAREIAGALGVQVSDDKKLDGQTVGGNFEAAVKTFLESTFLAFQHLRPGQWRVFNVGSARVRKYLGDYEPYTHLYELAEVVKKNPELEAVLGNGYVISPDVIVTRTPEPDDVINNGSDLIDAGVARQTIIREANARHLPASEILHAIVSCKWTIRSDRAQNIRSEALNLMRNRKGRLPHIVALTAEPTPSRLASIALGTGDIDMVYHLALPELMEAVDRVGGDTAKSLIHTMVEGQR